MQKQTAIDSVSTFMIVTYVDQVSEILYHTNADISSTRDAVYDRSSSAFQYTIFVFHYAGSLETKQPHSRRNEGNRGDDIKTRCDKAVNADRPRNFSRLL